MIRAVLFDFSGTLVNCGDAWWKLELVTTVRAPLELLHERRQITVSDADLARADDLYARLKREARETGIEIAAHDAARQAAAALGLSLPDGLLDAAVDELFCACLADCLPIDGAVDMLSALQQQGLVLAVISNARHGLFVRWALERLDMARFFQAIVVSADVRLRKPRPEIFWDTLRELGIAPSQAAFVGDYHPYDMVGAQAAGMYSIWLVEPDQPHDDLPADLVIDRLADLPPAVARLSRQ